MDDASTLIEEALTVLDEQASAPLASALISRAVYLVLSHRLEEGYGVLHHALALAERHDLPQVALRARLSLAAVSIEQCRLTEAVDELVAGLALARERGDRQWERALLGQEIAPRVTLGRWSDATPLAGPLLGGDLDSDGLSGAAFLSQLAVARGDQEMLARCEAMAEERWDSDHVDLRGLAGIVRARSALERSDATALQQIVVEMLAARTLAAEMVDELLAAASRER